MPLDSAASPCISPSTSRSGSRSCRIAQRVAHLRGRGVVLVAAEARVRQQRHPRRQAEAAHLLGGEPRHLGELLGRRVAVDVGVADEERVPRQHAAGSWPRSRPRPRAGRSRRRRSADGRGSAPKVPHSMASASPSRTSMARDQRAVAPHLGRRGVPLDAPAPAELVVRLDRALDQTPRRRGSPPRRRGPGAMRRPRCLILAAITSGRPTRTGWARLSSTATCAAAARARPRPRRRRRAASPPSAAAANTGCMTVPEW